VDRAPGLLLILAAEHTADPTDSGAVTPRSTPVDPSPLAQPSSPASPASTAELSRTEIKHIWERGHGAERDPQTDECLRPHVG
jgi:hypothetical protein